MISILVITISSPLLIGIYENNNLIEQIKLEGMTSDCLPTKFKEIMKRDNIKQIIYVNGPGSYMSIKISYIFLKTISIINKIDFKAISGFDINNNSPIKALGKKYFKIDENKDIILQNLYPDEKIEDFVLPKSLNDIKINDDTLPNYILPAIN